MKLGELSREIMITRITTCNMLIEFLAHMINFVIPRSKEKDIPWEVAGLVVGRWSENRKIHVCLNSYSKELFMISNQKSCEIEIS